MVGRFTRIDPVAEHFSWLTSYQYASNNPISKVDLDGLEGIFFSELPFLEESGLTPESIAKAGGDVSTKGTENLNRAANFNRGNQSESEQLSKNSLAKNTEPVKAIDPKTGQEGKTVPDALKNDGKSTVEVKDVKEQSLTKQLRLQESYSKGNGFKPELIINEGAKLSNPLQGSTFDIKTYQSVSIPLKTDATKTVIPNVKPIPKPKKADPPPCPQCS